MRFIVLLAALGIGLAAPATSAEKVEGSPYWEISGERLGFKHAEISAPVRAGTAQFYEARELSREGEGLDTVLLYRTADQELLASVYVYYPSVGHTGIQAISTDEAIKASSLARASVPVRPLGVKVAAAGGVSSAAVTADYENYLGTRFSKAAFVKAGRWMIKLRVTGPQPRAAEVESVMAALLSQMRFQGDSKARPATPISAADCPPASRADARLLPDGDANVTGALIGTFDAAGGVTEVAEGKSLTVPPRIGRDWCRSSLEVGTNRIPVLEATDRNGPVDKAAGKSMLFVLYSDAGGMFEVVKLKEKSRYLVLAHMVGEAKVLGAYDALPSPDQLKELFRTDGEPARIRAGIRLKPNGDAEVVFPTEPGKESPFPAPVG